MQSGSVILAVFGTIGLVGVLGASTMNMVRGPVTGIVRVTDHNMAKTQIIAAGQSVSAATLAQTLADCDHDGVIEPLPFRAHEPAPAGGGWLPANLGIAYQDPWTRPYGYCAWDHGSVTVTDDHPECDGAGAGRLAGAPDAGQAAIAVISAGPNGLFETSCHAWNAAGGDPVHRPAGSDDVVQVMPYGQFLMPSAAQARLKELPDAACTPDTAGIMRLTLGVVQVCGAAGWMDISPASGGDIYFEPVNNAMLNHPQQSNEVTFGALAGELAVSVGGGALLSVNDGPRTASGTVRAHDRLRLYATAPAHPEETRNYTVTVGPLTKIWRVTTRDAYIGSLSILPANRPDMNVYGPGSPAYGDTVSFVVTNNGERPVGPLLPVEMANIQHFGLHNGGVYVGDSCSGRILQGTMGGVAGESCVIDVRPKASADTALYQGSLRIGDGLSEAGATMSGAAQGWDCDLPWGGKLANGATAVAYLHSCSLLICKSEQRKCTNGELGGSFQHPACNALLC